MRQHQRSNLDNVLGMRDGLHGLAVIEEPVTAWVHAHLNIVRMV